MSVELRTPKPGHFWAYVCDREGQTAEPRVVVDTNSTGCHCVVKSTENGYFKNENYMIAHHTLWSKIEDAPTYENFVLDAALETIQKGKEYFSDINANMKTVAENCNKIVRITPDNFGTFSIKRFLLDIDELPFAEGVKAMNEGRLFAEVTK